MPYGILVCEAIYLFIALKTDIPLCWEGGLIALILGGIIDAYRCWNKKPKK